VNNVSRSLSSLQNHFCSLPNNNEGVSVISFCFPAKWSGVNGDTCLSLTSTLILLKQDAEPNAWWGRLLLNKARGQLVGRGIHLPLPA
jgi:hypothetical protein